MFSISELSAIDFQTKANNKASCRIALTSQTLLASFMQISARTELFSSLK